MKIGDRFIFHEQRIGLDHIEVCVYYKNKDDNYFFEKSLILKIDNELKKLDKPLEQKENAINLPSYYDNSKGSLYKVAEQREWNSYIFDVVKRLERGGKKDPLKQEIEKSIGVLQLWLNELDDGK